jgi:NitT/TauT family transport system ATP-binding protein
MTIPLESKSHNTTRASMSVACSVDDVSKVYFTKTGNSVVAVQHATFEIKKGEIVAVIGPSGCGKSTLLRILAGLDTEFAGTVTWSESNGRPPSATVFQQDSLFPWMTIAQNVALPMKPLGLSAAEKKERVEKYLTLTGLWDFADSYPHELSGGMRQRAAMARALSLDPVLLLLDEPFAALDAQTRIIMQQELLNLFELSPPAVMYVTHDIEEAVTLGHRVIVMSSRPGRIHHIEQIEIDRKPDVMARRNTAAFRETTEKLWSMLASQVGESLSAQKK